MKMDSKCKFKNMDLNSNVDISNAVKYLDASLPDILLLIKWQMLIF